MEIKTYTSEEILNSEDLYDLQDSACSSGIPFKYQMTKGEVEWFYSIIDKYMIANFINRNSTDSFLLTIDDIEKMSKALDCDCPGLGKGIMLSDETALQRIFFWLYQENNYE